MTVEQGTGLYETWILTLRAWQNDPFTSLDSLPELQEDTFSPDTYGRFVAHLETALRVVSDRWTEGLSRAFERANSPSDLGTNLVGLRHTLARRVQLSMHPSLPTSIREALTKDVHRAVERHQEEIEGWVRNPQGGRANRAEIEKMLDVVRKHSFMAVLNFQLDASRSRLESPPLPEMPGDLGRSRAARRGRQVMPPHAVERKPDA